MEATYEIIFEAMRLEKIRDDLQALDDNFFQACSKYVDMKAKNLDSETARTELCNTITMIRQLYERRQKKIVMSAYNAVKAGCLHTSNMLKFEKDFSNKMKAINEEHRLHLFKDILPQKFKIR